jgi:hypothetical protein
MLKRLWAWLTRQEHNVVDRLNDLSEYSQAEYNFAVNMAHDRLRSVQEHIQEEAHTELQRIEQMYKAASARIEKLGAAMHLVHDDHVDAVNDLCKKLVP